MTNHEHIPSTELRIAVFAPDSGHLITPLVTHEKKIELFRTRPDNPFQSHEHIAHKLLGNLATYNLHTSSLMDLGRIELATDDEPVAPDNDPALAVYGYALRVPKDVTINPRLLRVQQLELQPLVESVEQNPAILTPYDLEVLKRCLQIPMIAARLHKDE